MSNKKSFSKNILMIAAIVLLIAAFLSAGCVDLSASTTVRSDGTLSERCITAKTYAEYEYLLYEHIALMRAQGYTVDATYSGNNILITSCYERLVSIAKSPDMSFESSGGKITFRDAQFREAGSQDTLISSFAYTLKMPGKILNSNADEVRGNTAVWYSYKIERWAISEAPGFWERLLR